MSHPARPARPTALHDEGPLTRAFAVFEAVHRRRTRRAKGARALRCNGGERGFDMQVTVTGRGSSRGKVIFVPVDAAPNRNRQRTRFAAGTAAVALPTAALVGTSQYRAFQEVDRTARLAPRAVQSALTRHVIGSSMGLIALTGLLATPELWDTGSGEQRPYPLGSKDPVAAATLATGLLTVAGAGLGMRSFYSLTHAPSGAFRPTQFATNINERLDRYPQYARPAVMPLLEAAQKLIHR